MNIREIYDRILLKFASKKPVALVESNPTFQAYSIELIFFQGEDPVAVLFSITYNSIIAVVSPTAEKQFEVYSGTDIDEAAAEVIGWVWQYFKEDKRASSCR